MAKKIVTAIPKRSTLVMTKSRRAPWRGGWAAMFEKAKARAWPEDDNLHFHDLHGTASDQVLRGRAYGA